MPIISLKTGIKSRSLLVGNAFYNPTSYESIATFNATGSETTFTFTSIPNTYQHLQLRAIFQRNGGTQLDVGIRFNSDTGSNYSQHYLSGDGSAASASGAASSSYVSIGVGPGTSTSNMFGVSIIDIHDYASTTKNKTVRAAGGADTNNTGISAVRLWSGAWYNTNAISSLTIYPFGDAMNTGTVFALYGIKA